MHNRASLWACGAPRFGLLHQASTKPEQKMEWRSMYFKFSMKISRL